MWAPAPHVLAPELCLLLACVWLSFSEPAGESLQVQALGERDVDGGRPELGERAEERP